MLRTAALLATLSCGLATPGQAQDWNTGEALELVTRAREVRQAQAIDPELHAYRAEARGFVYFLLDRTDQQEQSLIKADQVALEVLWAAPRSTKQRIVGLRDQKLLPTNVEYHLDHLTVVQDDFGDRIRLGDGDEVADVIHPMASGSDLVYDFRLADSLTISFSGESDPVRVFKLEVRPKTAELPGFVGSVFVDRSSAAIVRMNFTFTASAYVDPYLDYIRISLDNSLWLGRHWLPYRQEVELRRELPLLDALAGSIIRSRFRILDYQLNPDFAEGTFLGRRVSAAPEVERRAFPFEEPLFSQLDQEGLSPPPSLVEIREQAAKMVQHQYLRGLGGLRLYLPNASSAYRFNRAEESHVGGGVALQEPGDWVTRVQAGYATGPQRPSADMSLEWTEDRSGRFNGFLNQPRDVGSIEGAGGVIRTMSALGGEDDWTDPYFSSGLSLTIPVLPGRLFGTARWEEDRSARLAVDRDATARPIRPIREGTRWSGSLRFESGADQHALDGLGFSTGLEQGVLDGSAYTRLDLSTAWGRTGNWNDLSIMFRLRAAASLSSGQATPPQLLELLGGRGTLLGEEYRAAVGDAFWLLNGEVTRVLWGPWISARGFAAVGQAGFLEGRLPVGWEGLQSDNGVRASVGLGLGLLWDALHIDLGHGLDGREWTLAFGVSPRFRAWL